MKDNKVLIVTYYWPPAGGPGVQRWLKFVKYLPEFGVKPVVYIPENPTYPIIDHGLQSEVGEEVTILKGKIFEPYSLASVFSKKDTKAISAGIIPDKKKQSAMQRLMLWLRGNLFIPDARVMWVKPSVTFLSDYIRENGITTVITSGPPHSLHLIGLRLKLTLAVKWIADFRDPWTTIGYHNQLKLSSFAEKKHKKLEKEVLDTADRIIVTSPSTRADFQAMTATPVTLITNGYDVETVTTPPMDRHFSIAHIGSLLSERNPLVLWKVLSDMLREVPGFATDFRLTLAGTVSGVVLESLRESGLAGHVIELGYLSHADAVARQRASQVLLLVEIDSEDTRSIIPGKLFEYMSAERPILAIGPEGSDIAIILSETNTGSYHLYDEYSGLRQRLEGLYQQYRSAALTVQGIGLQKYSRRQLTRQLADVIATL